jgi:uncharacterized protein (DUF433 family)
MQRDWATLTAVESNPEIVSGAWVFRGARVPVAALFENLIDGATVDQFLEWFRECSGRMSGRFLNTKRRRSMDLPRHEKSR